MKKMNALGKKLNKDEQRRIVGGRHQMVCTCNGSDMDTIVCSFGTFQGGINCLSGAQQYCTGHGYNGVSCNIGQLPD